MTFACKRHCNGCCDKCVSRWGLRVINGSPDVPARVAPPLIGIAASVARVSVFLPDSTSPLFVTLCWWLAGVMGCTGVYWGILGVPGCTGRCTGVTGGSVGKLRQSRQGTSPIITTLPYARSLNQLFFICRKNFH